MYNSATLVRGSHWSVKGVLDTRGSRPSTLHTTIGDSVNNGRGVDTRIRKVHRRALQVNALSAIGEWRGDRPHWTINVP